MPCGGDCRDNFCVICDARKNRMRASCERVQFLCAGLRRQGDERCLAEAPAPIGQQILGRVGERDVNRVLIEQPTKRGSVTGAPSDLQGLIGVQQAIEPPAQICV
jgi:hypothetical protein